MARTAKEAAAANAGISQPRDGFGILLGWKAGPAGDRILITLQSSEKKPQSQDDVQEFRYFLSKEQAVLLGNYLYTLAGQTAPIRRKPRFFDRLFGG